MRPSRKKTATALILSGFLLWGAGILLISSKAFCQTNTAEHVKEPVEQSIRIRQENQKERDQWKQEKEKLISMYEQLKHEHDTLLMENKNLAATQSDTQAIKLRLLEQKQILERIQIELLPFLKTLYTRVEVFVSSDTPFLKDERTLRRKTLEKVMKASDITIAEKYRKIMETLLIEAEYGNTIEVYQEKVWIGGQEVLGNIFRLGRLSLFFLSLDRTFCAYYNVAQKEWTPLANDHLPAIRSAVEIGSKRRPVELLSLPLGRLAIQGEGQ
ncbi:MAG: DUF3450 domain-containing protein [Proteobacteria bacterium]|nr:DUF3450 domain-containing protein [Pseudomonadota bacterium]MBU1581195.1 DUF3450 domain-containing protein [Pseudomonadota bacterium]MBU2455657.1 DUF3450 domain-containing protein [Pseudomonadota bacterium]MBU2628057.1 DUF3450 domain-containing protein [Pseudomonadota bacterium]